MRMGIEKNIGRGAMLYQNLQNPVQIAAFFGTGVKFAIGIGTGAAFAKTIIGIRVYQCALY